MIIKAKFTLSARAMATSGLIDSITEPVLCASCKFNYSFAEESDRVNTFNCYLLQSFCNNNKQMMLQLSRQLRQQQPPLASRFITSSSHLSQTKPNSCTRLNLEMVWSKIRSSSRHCGPEAERYKLSLSDKLMD